MLTQLLIRDETTASLGKTEHTFTVHVSGETISIRELIRQRVYQEVEEFNSRQPAVFRMLVQPNDTERTLNGFKFHKPRLVNPVTQYEKAIEAFAESNSALRYLWARTRIAELSDNRFAPETEASIKEVTELGLKYNLLTRFTSFIAVREKVVNPNAPANDVNQPLPLPVGVSDMAIGSEPEMFWLIGFAAILMAGVLMLRRSRFLPKPTAAS